MGLIDGMRAGSTGARGFVEVLYLCASNQAFNGARAHAMRTLAVRAPGGRVRASHSCPAHPPAGARLEARIPAYPRIPSFRIPAYPIPSSHKPPTPPLAGSQSTLPLAPLPSPLS